MARISTYSIDPNITADDKWIGTDFNTQYTKNFTPQYLADFFNTSNSIGVSGQVSFKYYSTFPLGYRPEESITTSTVEPNFSVITSLKIHKNSGGSKYCIDFVNYLSGDEILISDTSNADIFGHFKLNSVTQDLSETNFYNLSVTYIGGHGNLEHLNVYSIALYSAAITNPVVPTLQSVTDEGSITTNTITVGSLSGYYSQILPSAIGVENAVTGTYIYLDSSGYLGLSNAVVESYLKNTNVTNGGVVLEFPNKSTGSYTIATTEDVPPVPDLQSVTDEGITTTNNIQFIDNAEVLFGSGGGILLDNGSRLKEGTIDAGNGGSKGISQICAVGYELKWEAGRLYVMNGNGNLIRSSLYNFNITPTVNDDNTKAYYTGSLWSLDNGHVYECTDSTTGAAVWELKNTGVTSVGLTMPSAFTVTNSPITSSGDIAVTGAGLVSQYVRGDGTLANFPSSTGGGSSVNYYLNGSISQGTFGGTTYYQMSKTPILGAGTNFTRTNGAGNGYIASFITDAGDPSFLNIPGGNWNLEFYFQSSASGGSPQFYGEIYKVSATNVFTLVASGSANPEGITNGTTIDQYFTSVSVPQTSLLVTDRLAIRIYVITGGRTITLHTENGNLCEALTTFTTGLTALNGLTDQVQFFDVGTGATNFNISSSGDTHTFNLLFNIRRNANNSSNNNINYNGYAVTGSAESSAVWTITRLTIAASGSITTATATNVAWTNRESAIYT